MVASGNIEVLLNHDNMIKMQIRMPNLNTLFSLNQPAGCSFLLLRVNAKYLQQALAQAESQGQFPNVITHCHSRKLRSPFKKYWESRSYT